MPRSSSSSAGRGRRTRSSTAEGGGAAGHGTPSARSWCWSRGSLLVVEARPAAPGVVAARAVAALAVALAGHLDRPPAVGGGGAAPLGRDARPAAVLGDPPAGVPRRFGGAGPGGRRAR